ncbi:MAG: sodium:calcium symporter [Gammaproteobacteria bacterium]|nr:sodium:calcium symporter [Gammaproteobacteria bacterium]MDH5305030.1 sodium:calcium symporter [Gammaproteobacteria bacterium]
MTRLANNQAWGSRLGIVLAVSGSAVGLGNFLRFPGNAAENGGGAFLIPYFIAFLLLGIPIGWAEWTMGRYGGRKGFHSAPAIIGLWGRGPVARYFGSFGVLVPLVIYFYYVLIESWCLSYAWSYVSGGIGIVPGQTVAEQVAASGLYFNETTGANFDGLLASGGLHASVIFWAITFALNIYFLYRGLSRGIETFCRWAMPAMALCALIVLIRVLTLGTPDPSLPEQSVAAGLNFMWNPDFAALGNFQTWLAATGQIFFSLSVGFGVIINYASYLRKDDDIVLSSLTASATNEFFEVALGGMITLTAAVVFLGLTATQANIGGTFSTGFSALPVVFVRMPLGDFFGAIWFFMLFLAAITSSLSMLQPTKAFFQEALGLSHKGATVVVAGLCVAGNLFVLWFSKGLVALDTLDFWVGTFMIFVVAGTQIICFSWVFGVDKGLAEAHRGAQIRIPRVFRFIIKYVSPTYLLVIFLGFCWYNLPPYVQSVLGDPKSGVLPDRAVIYAWLVILGSIAMLMIVTAIGTRRWRAAGMDVDDGRPLAEPVDADAGLESRV